MADRIMCVECGTRWALYRSGKCQPCYRKERRGAKPIEGTCLSCGERFVSKRRYAPGSGRVMFCSPRCKAAARRADGRGAESELRWYYRTKYGLTLEQAVEMRRRGCAICGGKGEEGRWGNLHIDHDHETGVVRGVLCTSCNLGIGKFKDDVDLLRKAIKYLSR